jgi:hypothetical protein
VSSNSPLGRDRARVDRSRLTSQAPPAENAEPHPHPPAGGTSSSERLHDSRVAWGKLWGARISEATKRWKEEIN